jgi:hypothetical protein
VLGKKPEVLEQQARDAIEAGADGIVLFSYDSMVASPELFEAF